MKSQRKNLSRPSQQLFCKKVVGRLLQHCIVRRIERPRPFFPIFNSLAQSAPKREGRECTARSTHRTLGLSSSRASVLPKVQIVSQVLICEVLSNEDRAGVCGAAVESNSIHQSLQGINVLNILTKRY